MDRSRTRPPYPTLSPSQSSSAYTSSSSLSSMPSPGQTSHTLSFAQQSAPLPSPTTEQRHYFGSLNHSNTTAEQRQQQQRPQRQHQQQTRYYTRSSSLSQQQATSDMSSSQQQAQQLTTASQAQQPQQAVLDYAPDRQAAGATNAQTMAMLADYNLIAEAAKRAQVACMIRDLDEMDMS